MTGRVPITRDSLRGTTTHTRPAADSQRRALAAPQRGITLRMDWSSLIRRGPQTTTVAGTGGQDPAVITNSKWGNDNAPASSSARAWATAVYIGHSSCPSDRGRFRPPEFFDSAAHCGGDQREIDLRHAEHAGSDAALMRLAADERELGNQRLDRRGLAGQVDDIDAEGTKVFAEVADRRCQCGSPIAVNACNGAPSGYAVRGE